MAKVGLTARRRCQADTKVEHSEPMVGFRCRRRLPDKSYPGDNRLVVPKRPKRRHGSAPRCRLILSWRWSRCQGFGCSPIKKIRELGLDRSDSEISDSGQSKPLRRLFLLFVNEIKIDPTNTAVIYRNIYGQTN